MQRREALKSLAILTGGAVLIPSCNFEKEDILKAYSNLQITPTLQTLLGQIADTIIPPAQLKGASDLAVQDFILVMVNDCLDKDQQTQFVKGLQDFNAFSKKISGSAFSKLQSTEKEKVVTQGLSIGAGADENQKTIHEFLSITKRFTIQGFMMSEYIMTEVKPYSLIPGKYNGEVLISSISNLKING
ncbi:MAG: gluconate 2-dehydrogenase subunit 3 family protein [Cyclobacteriaceae bacterium]|nr:gluconate 2-dehydrogenase subunit 3 family protein [Cyclobacteriaceae bacterium]